MVGSLRFRDVVILLVALGIVFLIWRGEQVRAHELHRQNATILLQCNANYVVQDLVTATIAFVTQPPRSPGWREFVRTFETDHAILNRLLTDEASLCVRP